MGEYCAARESSGRCARSCNIGIDDAAPRISEALHVDFRCGSCLFLPAWGTFLGQRIHEVNHEFGVLPF